ncbi:hypothetical protein [Streptomyces scopuliridis]|uniref:hypothetical protein n=1 Tax=Streptomyces scopuliridis TaxID=452529 RepID=UPI00343DFE6B
MADKTGIEWTEQTPALRIRATAATRIGVTLAEYDSNRAAGLKWCTGCKKWHSRDAFATDRSRTDQLKARCRASAGRQQKATYVPKRRSAPGRRYVDARDGDQKQARRRVNHLVDVGILPHPNNVSCADCGHRWVPGQKRHEYDHHNGYAPEHHESVEAVCTTCHHTREQSRRTA